MGNLLGEFREKNSMNLTICKRAYNRASDALLKYSLQVRDLLEREEGQDLVEYALVVAIIAFGATTAMKGLSSEIKTAFSTISSDLGSSL
jgi:pilus assembly protein Flp/PilA